MAEKGLLKMRTSNILVVGGGAAGFFGAIAAAEAGARVALLERGREVLAKVRISGGGRCNVTHACFDPARLVEFYPRGGRELRGPFHRFQPRDTLSWFQARGVELKTEPDGRVFPASNDSRTIVQALTDAARKAGVRIVTEVGGLTMQRDSAEFTLRSTHGVHQGSRLLLATGSGAQGYAWARQLGHTLIPPVPSLFTFTVPDPRLKGLAGVSVDRATLSLERTDISVEGPLLITHAGLSGPAVLRLSAWGARVFHDRGYKTDVRVNWCGDNRAAVLADLKSSRTALARRQPAGSPREGFPRRLWERLASAAGIEPDFRWGDLSDKALSRWADQLTDGVYGVVGKSSFKEEFVTAGGVPLNEVDFKTMESRRCAGLFFAGEILDIDGVTGGFNFQNAWTTGWIAGRAMAGAGP